MSQLPAIRKFYVEDYPSQKDWIGPFILTLNTFTQAVVNALTKSLTIVDNTTSDIKQITLSAVPTAAAPASIAWTKPMNPVAVIVGNCTLKSGIFALTNAVQVQWQMSQTSSSLQIIAVSGITPTPTAQYVLTLVCIAG